MTEYKVGYGKPPKVVPVQIRQFRQCQRTAERQQKP